LLLFSLQPIEPALADPSQPVPNKSGNASRSELQWSFHGSSSLDDGLSGSMGLSAAGSSGWLARSLDAEDVGSSMHAGGQDLSLSQSLLHMSIDEECPLMSPTSKMNKESIFQTAAGPTVAVAAPEEQGDWGGGIFQGVDHDLSPTAIQLRAVKAVCIDLTVWRASVLIFCAVQQFRAGRITKEEKTEIKTRILQVVLDG
jgi:hypothetical protein